MLEIYIQDNGKGFDSKEIENQKNIGISNVQERLLIAYRKATLSIKSEIGKGTEVIIKIPIEDITT